MENIVILLFLVFFAAEFCVEFYLNETNMTHVRRQWSERRLPEALRDRIGDAEYGKIVEYTLVKGRFQRWAAGYGGVVTLGVLFGGVLPYLDEQARSLGGLLPAHTEATGILFCVSTGFILSVASLPTELYSTFVIEDHFGFNRTTAKVYWLDKLKGLLVGLVLGVPFLFAILWLMRVTGPYWWVWAFCFVFAFQFLMMIAYPTLIAPLFNKFVPLPDNELKDAITELAHRVGIKTTGIFTMDGSRRSGHSNAYFTGLGRAKRIVLFDTLLSQLGYDQVLAVLGHEMGHYKKTHVPKMLALGSIFLLAGFYVLSLLLDYRPMFTAFGLEDPTTHAALVLFSLLAGTFTFWLGPMMNYLSRKHEYEADAFATQVLRDGKSLEESLINLTVKNLSNLTPHPWYSAYHYSHPTTVERVAAIRKLEADLS